jgi:hypothetical protein
MWRTWIICKNPTFTAQAKRQYSKKNCQYFQYRALLCAQKHFHKMHGPAGKLQVGFLTHFYETRQVKLQGKNKLQIADR